MQLRRNSRPQQDWTEPPAGKTAHLQVPAHKIHQNRQNLRVGLYPSRWRIKQASQRHPHFHVEVLGGKLRIRSSKVEPNQSMLSSMGCEYLGIRKKLAVLIRTSGLDIVSWIKADTVGIHAGEQRCDIISDTKVLVSLKWAELGVIICFAEIWKWSYRTVLCVKRCVKFMCYMILFCQ